jgi:hypothetical protein
MGKDAANQLIGGEDLRQLLAVAARHAGGELLSFQLDRVEPGADGWSATYLAEVDWPYGRRREVFGVSMDATGIANEPGVEIFSDGDVEAACWIYPKVPDLPGLATVAYPEAVAEMCNAQGVFNHQVSVEELTLTMIGYRPRRRAVVSIATVDEAVFAKVYRVADLPHAGERQRLLFESGLPVAQIKAATADGIIVSSELKGESLAMLLPNAPISAQALVSMLDAMPVEIAWLPKRTTWVEALPYYVDVLSEILPGANPLLNELAAQIQTEMPPSRRGEEPTHGDLHAGQILIKDGQISGLLDPDTAGPGHRVDDLASMLAHLLTTHCASKTDESKLHDLIAGWVPVFDRRVDPLELRLRTAAVIVSLAVQPYADQTPRWQSETRWMLRKAEALARQVAC